MKTKVIFSALILFVALAFGANRAPAQTVVQSVDETDIQFLDMMIPHHADGVKMARMGEDKAQNARIRTLARKMAADQQKDIGEMEKMRERHYSGQPKAGLMTVKGRQMTIEMMEKMAQEDMQKLEAATRGRQFDHRFLDIFLKHHQMAIDMSRQEIMRGQNAQVKRKAREIISKQTREMAEMRRLRAQIGRPARSGR